MAPPARIPTPEYLGERQEYLEKRDHPEAKQLIPCIYGGRIKEYSGNWFMILKRKVEEGAGVAFKLKDLRSTFAQLSIDRDPNLLSDVSQQLGHATTHTTAL